MLDIPDPCIVGTLTSLIVYTCPMISLGMLLTSEEREPNTAIVDLSIFIVSREPPMGGRTAYTGEHAARDTKNDNDIIFANPAVSPNLYSFEQSRVKKGVRVL